MNTIVTIVMYALWVLALIGILLITFTNFQHLDLDIIVSVIFLFTLVNTFFVIKSK